MFVVVVLLCCVIVFFPSRLCIVNDLFFFYKKPFPIKLLDQCARPCRKWDNGRNQTVSSCMESYNV